MSEKRIEIGNKLKLILGNNRTYYQPPENIKLVYPCAIYSLDGIESKNADDRVYFKRNRYTVIFITTDPDNNYYDGLIDNFDIVRFDQRYISDGLYHDVYTIY